MSRTLLVAAWTQKWAKNKMSPPAFEYKKQRVIIQLSPAQGFKEDRVANYVINDLYPGARR